MPKTPIPSKKRVLLIGWDAADWEIIDPLLEKGHMPNLKKFLDEGVRGNVATLLPILSPILWNSIATGKTAEKHDILGFLEPDGNGGVRPVTSTSRKAKAIWNILSQCGKRSAVVGWFASHPAEKINGVIVTDRYRNTWGKKAQENPLDERTIYPASLIEPLSDLIVEPNDISAEQALPFIPLAMEVDHTKDKRLAAFASVFSECATIHNAATYLAENEEWDLLAVYYDAIDHFGHGFMEFHPPKMAHVSDRDMEVYGGVMTRVVEYHDMMLGRLLQLVGPDTTVIILSDHGFLSDERRPPLMWAAGDPPKKVGPGMNPVAWHRPFGMVAMHGPNIKKGQTISGASLLDIAPTILAMLDMAIPNDMDGKPLVQAFENQPELKSIDSYEPEHSDDGIHRGEAIAEDPWVAQEALKQLAELGYIENPSEDQAKNLEQSIIDRKSNLAQVHFSCGRTHQAVQCLRELVEIQPKAANFRARLALALLTMQRYDETEKVLEGHGKDPAAEPMLSILQAQVHLYRGRDEEGMKLLREIRSFHPRMSLVHLYIANGFLKARKWDEAEASYRTALEIDPDDAEANDRLGVVLRRKRQFEDAVYYHMKSSSLLHNRPVTHLNLGYSLVGLQQWDWAIQAFNTALSLAPGLAAAHRALSRVYSKSQPNQELAKFHRHKAAELRMENMRRRAKGAMGEQTWA